MLYQLWRVCVCVCVCVCRGVSGGERQGKGIGGDSRFYKGSDIVPFGML